MRLSVSKSLMFLLIMLLVLFQQQPVSAAVRPGSSVDTAHVCLQATQRMEHKYHIKKHLLTTISSIESGRWNERDQQTLAWPWTVNAQGRGYFFDTKAEALRKIRELRAQGITSIDVGCMQVNLLYHGHEFSSIEKALDPARNVEYAARFLRDLYETNNHDWLKAAMSYHSAVPEKANAYRRKIVERFEIVKTAHKKDMNLTSRPRISMAKNDLLRQPKKLRAPRRNTVTARSLPRTVRQAQASKPSLDVKAWREAKLEEYRQQRLQARHY